MDPTLNRYRSLRVCRVCLESDPNKKYFADVCVEEYCNLTNLNISNVDKFHLLLCADCLHLIRKFTKFRDKCLKAQRVFQEFDKRYERSASTNDCMNILDLWLKTNVKMSKSISTTKMLTFEIVYSKNSKLESAFYVIYSHNERKDCADSLDDSHNLSCQPAEFSKQDLKGALIDDEDLLINIKEEKFEYGYYDTNHSEEYLPDLDFKENASDDSDTPLIQCRKHKKRKRNDDTSNEKHVKPKLDNQHCKVSNRMVLETDQYKVIKLTDAQVLDEMKAKASSAKYLAAPYRCQLCVKGFNYEDVLQNHSTRHEPQQRWLECRLCHQYVPSAVSLRGHIKSHTTKYECKKCGVVKASRQHLVEHYSYTHDNSPKVYICTYCGKTCNKRTMYQKHMRLHQSRSKIKCEECGKLFKTIETLRAHRLRHADVARYRCEQCPKEFRYASLLYTHKLTHITSRNFYCVECDLRFKTSTNLKIHLRKSLKHASQSTLKHACTLCEKRYDDARSLKQHVEWYHMKRRNHKCSQCDMSFGSADGLRSHTRKKHDGVTQQRTHTCEICRKAFKTKAVLIKHIRVHTGERPYECRDCGKKFAQYSTMTTHVKLVHLKMQRNGKKSGHALKKDNSDDKIKARVDIPPLLPIVQTPVDGPTPETHASENQVTYQNTPNQSQPSNQFAAWYHHAAVSLSDAAVADPTTRQMDGFS